MNPAEVKARLVPITYRINAEHPPPSTLDRVRIEERRGYGTVHRWAVTRDGLVLSKSGEWEYEPLPSHRTEAFFDRCRFDSIDEACEAICKVHEADTL